MLVALRIWQVGLVPTALPPNLWQPPNPQLGSDLDRGHERGQLGWSQWIRREEWRPAAFFSFWRNRGWQLSDLAGTVSLPVKPLLDVASKLESHFPSPRLPIGCQRNGWQGATIIWCSSWLRCIELYLTADGSYPVLRYSRISPDLHQSYRSPDFCQALIYLHFLAKTEFTRSAQKLAPHYIWQISILLWFLAICIISQSLMKYWL